MKKYGTNLYLDKLIDSDNLENRKKVIRLGYGLDKLFNDEDADVRYIVNKYLKEHNYKSIFNWAKDNNVDLNIDIGEWINSDDYHKRCVIAEQGYGLNKLVNDVDADVRIAVAYQGYGLDKLAYDEYSFVRKVVYDYLREHNLTLDEWCIQNNKSPVIVQNLKDFVYKVEDSSKIKVETFYESIDAFFEDFSNKSYEDKNSIVFMTVDTKIPLIKLEKTRIEDKNCFKFIVDISNKNDDFRIRSIFDTKEKFDQLLQLTINALQGYSQFSKYADELELCL